MDECVNGADCPHMECIEIRRMADRIAALEARAEADNESLRARLAACERVVDVATAWKADQRGWLKPLDEALRQAVDEYRATFPTPPLSRRPRPMRERVMYGAFEWGLWMFLLLAAYGQRDAWRDGDWISFFFSSVLASIIVPLLRKHIAVSTKESTRLKL
jgi:hypothetical protein